MSSYHISFDWGVVSEELVRATAGIEDAASLCLFMSEEPVGSLMV